MHAAQTERRGGNCSRGLALRQTLLRATLFTLVAGITLPSQARGQDTEDHIEMLRAIQRHGDRCALLMPEIRKALRSTELAVAVEAAMSLWTVDKSAAEEARTVLAHALNVGCRAVATRAAECLGATGELGLDMLAEALRNSRTRGSAIAGLSTLAPSELEASRVLPSRLAEALAETRDPEMLAEGLAIAALNRETSVACLVVATRAVVSAEIAPYALAVVRVSGCEGGLTGDLVSSFLAAEGLSRAGLEEAGRCCAELGRPGVAIAFGHLAKQGEESSALPLLEGLIQGNPELAAVCMISATSSESPLLRRWASTGLELCGGETPEGMRALVARLEDLEPSVRQAAALAICWPSQHAPTSVPVERLAPLVTSPDEAVRIGVACALGNAAQGNKQAIRALLELLQDSSERVRLEAVAGVTLAGGTARAAGPLLKEWLASGGPPQPLLNALASVSSGDPDVIRLLGEAVTSGDPSLEWLGARRLGSMERAAAPVVPSLRALARSDRLVSRLEALHALWRIQDEYLPLWRELASELATFRTLEWSDACSVIDVMKEMGSAALPLEEAVDVVIASSVAEPPDQRIAMLAQLRSELK